MKFIIFAGIVFVVAQNAMNINAGNFGICGYDPEANETYKTFATNCTLKAYNYKQKTNYTYLYLGECDENTGSPEVCTEDYNPVCACNVTTCQTFSNNCSFQAKTSNQTWQYRKNGECNGTVPCPKFCTMEYRPICACNSTTCQTFATNCTFRSKTCDQNWQFRNNGSCNETNNCPTVCTKQYSPICACNSTTCKTFGNNCTFQRDTNCSQSWEYLQNGECTETTPCPEICPFIYSPVCACNSTTCQTFSNNCIFQAQTCGQTWEIRNNGTCNETNTCPTFCTREYNPICACNSTTCQTFPTNCTFQAETNCSEAWQYLQNGECNGATPCPQVCTQQYSPVCACNATTCQTFSNNCMFRAQTCGQTWQFRNDGTCEETVNCPTACTEQYSPICACNSTTCQTFGNNCTFQRDTDCSQTWQYFQNGECTETTPCPQACYLIYSPICACNETTCQTFSNDCFFRADTNCSQTWQYLKDGECTEEDTP